MPTQRNIIREKVWIELKKYSLPDSRFHYNFAEFIADYEGSEKSIKDLTELNIYRKANILFITPDNNLVKLREISVKDNKLIIMPTYGIKRGFLTIQKDDVPTGQETFASTLDGMEKFARPISLEEIAKIKQLDLMVTGASIITHSGIRFGKGHGFFDLEWAMMREINVVNEETPIVAMAHDCQIVDMDLIPADHDTIVDYIITPTRTIHVSTKLQKPKKIDWNILPKEMRESIPPLQKLYQKNKGK